jgi:nicotinate phosphoribosyltransferase
MQQAILYHFPDVQAMYRFTLRDKDVYFSRTCYDQFLQCLPRTSSIKDLIEQNLQYCATDFKTLELTSKERAQLEKHCPYFKPAYLDYLEAYRFKPEQVRAKWVPKDGDPNLGRLDMEAYGLWSEAILWEVPLMACLSETYFSTDEIDWSYEGQAGKF